MFIHPLPFESLLKLTWAQHSCFERIQQYLSHWLCLCRMYCAIHQVQLWKASFVADTKQIVHHSTLGLCRTGPSQLHKTRPLGKSVPILEQASFHNKLLRTITCLSRPRGLHRHKWAITQKMPMQVATPCCWAPICARYFLCVDNVFVQ